MCGPEDVFRLDAEAPAVQPKDAPSACVNLTHPELTDPEIAVPRRTE
jgi:hypothetical protein